MKGLPGDHEINAGSRQRGFLRRSGDVAKLRVFAQEIFAGLAHIGVGLDAIKQIPVGQEHLRQQAGARAYIGNRRFWGQRAVVTQHFENLRRVAGAVADVVVHAVGETLLGIRGNCGHGPG